MILLKIKIDYIKARLTEPQSYVIKLKIIIFVVALLHKM